MSEPHHQLSPDSGAPDRSLRAADHDREAVADILREQHVAGRLDTDELQDRIERCYVAKTYGELDAVIADLPAQIESPRARRRGRPRPGLPLPALAPLLILAIALSHGFLIWLAVPFVFWFIGRRWRWRSTM